VAAALGLGEGPSVAVVVAVGAGGASCPSLPQAEPRLIIPTVTTMSGASFHMW